MNNRQMYSLVLGLLTISGVFNFVRTQDSNSSKKINSNTSMVRENETTDSCEVSEPTEKVDDQAKAPKQLEEAQDSDNSKKINPSASIVHEDKTTDSSIVLESTKKGDSSIVSESTEKVENPTGADFLKDDFTKTNIQKWIKKQYDKAHTGVNYSAYKIAYVISENRFLKNTSYGESIMKHSHRTLSVVTVLTLATVYGAYKVYKNKNSNKQDGDGEKY